MIVGPLGSGVGGGGPPVPPFEQGLIRIESVGLWYDNLIDGDGAQNIPQPTINVNDDLFVIIGSSGILAQPSNPGDWLLQESGLAGTVKVFKRKADGTAADEFGIAAHSQTMLAANMSAIRHTTEPTDTPTIFQGGSLNTPNIGNDWDYGFPPGTSMALNTTNDPDAFAMSWGFKRSNTDTVFLPGVGTADPQGMETIASRAMNELNIGIGQDYMWINFKFQYRNPGIGYDAYDNSYTPFPINGNHYTHHVRYAYAP